MAANLLIVPVPDLPVQWKQPLKGGMGQTQHSFMQQTQKTYITTQYRRSKIERNDPSARPQTYFFLGGPRCLVAGLFGVWLWGGWVMYRHMCMAYVYHLTI